MFSPTVTYVCSHVTLNFYIQHNSKNIDDDDDDAGTVDIMASCRLDI